MQLDAEETLAKKIEVESKTDKLRALRLAHEAARKEAGTWGEMTVGEIMHEATRSVFVQVWKGHNRPDPFRQRGARQIGIGATEWLAMTAWVNARRGEGFTNSVVAKDVTKEEAHKIAEARITHHDTEGYTVMNPIGGAL